MAGEIQIELILLLPPLMIIRSVVWSKQLPLETRQMQLSQTLDEQEFLSPDYSLACEF
jgi:hypothetical protein